MQAIKNRYDKLSALLKLTSLLKEGVDFISDRYRIKVRGLHLIYLRPKKAKSGEKNIAEVHTKNVQLLRHSKDYQKSYQ